MRERISCGSALKFGLIAAGEADLYPRFGTTMEWDTAAGQAILEAAGGRVETFAGDPLPTASPASKTTASSPGAAARPGSPHLDSVAPGYRVPGLPFQGIRQDHPLGPSGEN